MTPERAVRLFKAGALPVAVTQYPNGQREVVFECTDYAPPAAAPPSVAAPRPKRMGLGRPFSVPPEEALPEPERDMASARRMQDFCGLVVEAKLLAEQAVDSAVRAKSAVHASRVRDLLNQVFDAIAAWKEDVK